MSNCAYTLPHPAAIQPAAYGAFYPRSTYTASLSSSVLDYPMEHGRRYHAYQKGCTYIAAPVWYPGPRMLTVSEKPTSSQMTM